MLIVSSREFVSARSLREVMMMVAQLEEGSKTGERILDPCRPQLQTACRVQGNERSSEVSNWNMLSYHKNYFSNRAVLHLGVGRCTPDPSDPDNACFYDYLVCMDLKGMLLKSAINQVGRGSDL